MSTFTALNVYEKKTHYRKPIALRIDYYTFIRILQKSKSMKSELY